MIFWCLAAVYIFPKWGWIFCIFLTAAQKNIQTGWGFNQHLTFIKSKDPKNIRVLSWNVNQFVYGNKYDAGWKEKQEKMLQFIRESESDILCFQDFIIAYYDEQKDLLKHINESLRYPYNYFSIDAENYGTIILSRFPIIDSGRFVYQNQVKPESLAFADLLINGRKLRIYNTHLRSMYLHHNHLSAELFEKTRYIKEDTGFLFSSSRLSRLEYYDKIHTEQAFFIKKILNASPTPFIFCADLNAVPASFTYHHIQKGLKDAFIEKGRGWGVTYDKYFPTLRIDVLLTSPTVKTIQYDCPKLPLSDHYPIMADLYLAN